MLAKFLLEDIYNQTEGQYDSSPSSGIISPLTFAELANISGFSADDLFERMRDCSLDYTTRYGSESLRELITTLYINLSADDLILCSGASEGIYLLASSLFATGDKILVQSPIYQSLFQLAADQGAEIIPLEHQLGKVNEFINSIETNLANCDIKALVLNNPNNPSGFLLNNEQLRQVCDLCAQYQAWLIVDEVFWKIIPEQKSAIDFYDKAVVISDLSKAFAMPGLRLGWIACKDPGLRNKFSSQKNYLSLRTNVLSELCAEAILPYACQILERNRKILEQNFKSLLQNKNEDDFLQLFDYGAIEALDYVPPCIFPKLKDPNFNLQSYCHDKLKKERVFILEGTCFDKPTHIRLGFGQA